MGYYRERILPRLLDVALAAPEFARMRARVASALGGEVLEVGFGSGRNVPHYPPTVTRVRAVDPATVGRRMAAKRIAIAQVPVEYVDLDGRDLSLEDESIDHVLATRALCSIPDVRRALLEIQRVLRPRGSLHFLEHGRSPDPKVGRWQDRITPITERIVGGCHPNRPIDHLIADAGLHVARIDNYYTPGPKAVGYMFEGFATKPSLTVQREERAS
jgi:ubiquinone/menaquinone biosynthesis C-methylase UbiE